MGSGIDGGKTRTAFVVVGMVEGYDILFVVVMAEIR